MSVQGRKELIRLGRYIELAQYGFAPLPESMDELSALVLVSKRKASRAREPMTTSEAIRLAEKIIQANVKGGTA